MRECVVPDCERKHCASGYCRFHYNRVRRTGTPDAQVHAIELCTFNGCTAPVKSRGLCQKHYRRWQRHGSPDVRLRARDDGPDETRWMQKVSVESPGCWLWNAGQNGFGYGAYSVGARNYSAHRYVYEQLVGPIPEGTELDHLCRRPACVNPDHLEPVTHLLNVQRGSGPAVARIGRGRKICTVDGCGGFRVGRGLCRPHYAKAKRAGALPPLI